MQNTSTYSYILIGLLTRHGQSFTAGVTAAIAKENQTLLKKALEQGGFNVTMAALRGSNYLKVSKELEKLDDAALLGILSAEINQQNSMLEQVLFAEAVTKKVYVLPTRRFNSDILLAEPAKLLKPGAFEKLEEIAKGDLASAGRCILFGEATAAAFHMLRATESVLTSYYFHHRKQRRLSKPMWGPMLDQLKAKKRNVPPKTLLESLDLIRHAYRNPTQHPTATYGIDNAQDLMGVCLDVIGKMADEL